MQVQVGGTGLGWKILAVVETWFPGEGLFVQIWLYDGMLKRDQLTNQIKKKQASKQTNNLKENEWMNERMKEWMNEWMQQARKKRQPKPN